MNIRYLRQFLELSRFSSMNQYASQNNVTHGQVSRMVSELEKYFGYTLLIRDKTQTRLKLTKKGAILVRRIPFIFREIDNMRSLLDQDMGLEHEIFDLTTTAHLVDYWISPYLRSLKDKYPYLTLNLFCKEDAPSLDDKKTQLTISPYVEDAKDIVQVKLKDFHIGLWASQSYIDRCGLPETISDLSQHTVICFERHWPDRAYPTINWYMNNNNAALKLENVIVIKSSIGIMKAAHEGLGIFSLSEENIKITGMTFERILPEFKGPIVPMCLTYPVAWEKHPVIKLIETFLISLFQK